MKEGLIGVIVPVYKVEKYVAECIESILAQTYTNFRLILVDDGTPDNAGKICDEYAKKDSRITVIHQENAGVTRARARGVEEATDCEWITFVDGDDTIPNTAIATLYEANSENTDIIIASAEHLVYDNADNLIEKIEPLHYIDGIITTEEYLEILFRENYNTKNGVAISPAPWAKLFRSKLFKESTLNTPRDIVIAEDLIMNINLALQTRNNIQIVSKTTYNYRVYSNNTSNTFKRTPDNEHKIHTQKMLAVSNELRDKYTPFTIPIRFYRYKTFYAYTYSAKHIKTSSFYKELKKDINKYHYKIPLLERIIFFTHNTIIRFFIINLKKVFNKISTLL